MRNKIIRKGNDERTISKQECSDYSQIQRFRKWVDGLRFLLKSLEYWTKYTPYKIERRTMHRRLYLSIVDLDK
jgi:hypothetical protein